MIGWRDGGDVSVYGVCRYYSQFFIVSFFLLGLFGFFSSLLVLRFFFISLVGVYLGVVVLDISYIRVIKVEGLFQVKMCLLIKLDFYFGVLVIGVLVFFQVCRQLGGVLKEKGF